MIHRRKDRFPLERMVLAPPVVERGSPFRHRQILRSFERGVAEVLHLTPLLPSEARRHFGSEFLHSRPKPQRLQTFLERNQQGIALFALLRFLPKDMVEAEIWAYLEHSPRPVLMAQTSLHHIEALGSLWMAGKWGDLTDPCPDTLASRPRTFADQTLTHIHPNLLYGSRVSGLSKQDAEKRFYDLGSSLAKNVQETKP
jgi:hypothetical protein